MRREKTLVSERRERLYEEIKRLGRASVSTLAGAYHLPVLTVRRELGVLEAEGRVKRFYGGAALPTPEGDDPIQRARERIARYAASLVQDGENIFLNSSMTALGILKYLGDKRVTVITNNGRVISADLPPHVSVVLTGGELRYPKHVMVGEFCARNLQGVTVNRSFLGCSGLSPAKGMTSSYLNEAPLNHLMFTQAHDGAYLLADHTKLGVESNFVSVFPEELRTLITDEGADEALVSRFRAMGIDVVTVPVRDEDA